MLTCDHANTSWNSRVFKPTFETFQYYVDHSRVYCDVYNIFLPEKQASSIACCRCCSVASLPQSCWRTIGCYLNSDLMMLRGSRLASVLGGKCSGDCRFVNVLHVAISSIFAVALHLAIAVGGNQNSRIKRTILWRLARRHSTRTWGCVVGLGCTVACLRYYGWYSL